MNKVPIHRIPRDQIPEVPKRTEPYKRPSRAKNPLRKVRPEDYVPKKKREGDVDTRVRVNGQPYAPENPYKAGKYVSDPRQAVCWEIFLKGWVNGDQNAAGAARQAGYSETTASNITNQLWFKEKFIKLKRKDMLSKAERNLDRILDIDYTKLDEITGKEGIDIDKAKLVADISKMMATTLGKDEGYSTKSTVDQKVSGQVNIKAVNYADMAPDQLIEQPKQADVIDITGEEISE
jgi:hypothetical protein